MEKKGRGEMKRKQELMELMKHPEPRKRVGIIKTQVVREGSLLYGKRRFQTPREAVNLVQSIFEYADKELFVVVSLDSKNAPLALEIVSVGTVNACLVQMRELFKHAILDNAAQIICFHNHPSGIPKASKEDVLVTTRIRDAGNLLGIKLLDHIIIGAGDSYSSFMENGMLGENTEGERERYVI